MIAKRKTSDHGEVPEVFRTHSFELSISGKNWGNATFWRPAGRVYTIIEALLYPNVHFTSLTRTEVIDGVTNPHFTTRASLPALDMSDSQAVARKSVIRVRAFSRGVQIGVADVSLASLIWDGGHYGTLSTSGIDSVCPANPNDAFVRIAVLTECKGAFEERMGIDHYYREGHVVKFSVWLDPSFTESVQGQCEVTLSVSGERGHWVQVGAAATVLKASTGRRVGRIEVLRKDVTTASQQDRELRIAVAGLRKGFMTPVGFVQFELRTLAASQWAEWRFAKRQGLAAAVRVKKCSASPSVTDIDLEIGVNRAVLRDDTDSVRTTSTNEGKGLMGSLSDSFWWPLAGNLNDAKYNVNSRKKRVVAPKHVVKFPERPMEGGI